MYLTYKPYGGGEIFSVLGTEDCVMYQDNERGAKYLCPNDRVRLHEYGCPRHRKMYRGIRVYNRQIEVYDDVKDLFARRPMVYPEAGEFEAYAGVYAAGKNYSDTYPKYHVMKLSIPADARRTSRFDGLGRSDRAKILDIQQISTIRVGTYVDELYMDAHRFRAGDWVTCDVYDDDRLVPDGEGIRFWATFMEAYYNYVAWPSVRAVE